jgi:hypothetical protein
MVFVHASLKSLRTATEAGGVPFAVPNSRFMAGIALPYRQQSVLSHGWNALFFFGKGETWRAGNGGKFDEA